MWKFDLTLQDFTFGVVLIFFGNAFAYAQVCENSGIFFKSMRSYPVYYKDGTNEIKSNLSSLGESFSRHVSAPQDIYFSFDQKKILEILQKRDPTSSLNKVINQNEFELKVNKEESYKLSEDKTKNDGNQYYKVFGFDFKGVIEAKTELSLSVYYLKNLICEQKFTYRDHGD